MSGRRYRVIDPGDSDRLARVEMSDDGIAWRETPNVTRRMTEHYRLHGSRPPGIDSTSWPRVRARMDERNRRSIIAG